MAKAEEVLGGHLSKEILLVRANVISDARSEGAELLKAEPLLYHFDVANSVFNSPKQFTDQVGVALRRCD